MGKNSVTQDVFAHLPPYQRPTHGPYGFAPDWAIPYLELCRMDKPGFLIVYLYHLMGATQAAIFLGTPPATLFTLWAYFGPMCAFIMWINFSWNDTCDVELDRQVPRSRHRPLVRGALSMTQAHAVNTFIAAVLFAFVYPLPTACLAYALPYALGCFWYPLTKRWFNFPQVVLGVVFPLGIFLAAGAVGGTPLPYPPNFHPSTLFNYSAWIKPEGPLATAIMTNYLTNLFWTILYEIVYSYQDAEFDGDAGVGTITQIIKTKRAAKMLLSSLAAVQVALFIYNGVLTNATSLFWYASVVLTAFTLVNKIVRVDLGSEASCFYWFSNGSMFTGMAMLFGFISEYFVQVVFTA